MSKTTMVLAVSCTTLSILLTGRMFLRFTSMWNSTLKDGDRDRPWVPIA